MRPRPRHSWLLLAGVMAASPAWADDDLVAPPARVSGAREVDDAQAPEASRTLDEPTFVTVVDLHMRDGEAPAAADVLARTVGVSVRSLGGPGAFASIAIRGAASAQTEVLVDGVPMSRVGFASVDLASFDLGTFDVLEVWRGHVPVALGGAALGGAVNFVTSIGPRAGQGPNRLVLLGGSWGARGLRFVRRDAALDGRFGSTLGVGYAGATGDYPIFDDNGTPYELGDDREVARINNGYDQLDAVWRGRYRHDGLTIEGGTRWTRKTQGLPGPVGAGARHASLASWRGTLDGKVTRTGVLGLGGLDAGAAGHLAVEGQRFRDPAGEVGLGAQDNHYLTVAGGGTLHVLWAPTAWQALALGAEPRVEAFAQDEALGEMRRSGGLRLGIGATLADTLALGDERWLVVPAVRLDVLAARPTGDAMSAPLAADPLVRSTVVEPSPRLQVRFAAAPWLTVKGNVGRYFRPPTTIELYGDRGILVGNGALRPETGWSADLGAVVAPARAFGAFDQLYLEGALYTSRPRDLIVWLPTAGQAAVAQNLEGASLRGVELTAGVRAARHLHVSGNYTLLDSRLDSPSLSYGRGLEVPGRPRHEGYLRLDGDARLFGVDVAGHVDLSATAGNWLDQGNTQRVPARRFLGVGVRGARHGVTLSLDVRNLLDERVEDVALPPPRRPDLASIPRAVSDVLGYPLPGRSFMATLAADF